MSTNAGGGTGGSSAYDKNNCTLQSGTSYATGVDPYIEIEYTSASATGSTVDTTTNVTGAQTKTLTLSRNTVGIHTVQCKISHPIAVNNPASVLESSGSTRENSPLWTDKVEFNALSAVNLTRSLLTYEVTKDNSNGIHASETVNLFVQPMPLEGTPTNENATRNIHVYAHEEDIAVKIWMAGSAGQSFNGNHGGWGGRTIFKYTLQRNKEYTFKLGSTVEPTSSLGRGGAGAYFYEGGRLLVACGGGGAAGWAQGVNGGNGGGADVPGRPGGGASGGSGGQKVNVGELSSSGKLPFTFFGSQGAQGKGGKVESCTTGQYWRDQGFSPCQDVGRGKFRDNTGREVTSTNNNIIRGYKADTDKYGYRHNGGNSKTQINGTYIGGGGAGAYGGDSCPNLFDGGGGGGSGYTNGSVTILHTQVGGNGSANAYALIELLTADNDTTDHQTVENP